MWISKKKYQRMLSLIEELGNGVKEAVEEFTESMSEMSSENKLLREELTKKNDFIENLLSQMISGAVNSISGPKAVSSSVSVPLSSTNGTGTRSKAMEEYLAKKNGEAVKKLPG